MQPIVKQTRRVLLSRLPLLGTLGLSAVLGGGLLWNRPANTAEGFARLAVPKLDRTAAADEGMETAILAGGCFWGIQGLFQHVKGVEQAVSGYAGGTAETAHYQMVGSGRTKHAEAVQIRFDPKQISFGRILQIFFSTALDPTQVNRQGPDVGPQYRSAIFYTSEEQKKIAEAYIAQLDAPLVFGRKIATKVDPATEFYPAEDYHQDYLTLNPYAAYIQIYDMPKLVNLQRLFPEVYREEPVLVSAR